MSSTNAAPPTRGAPTEHPVSPKDQERYCAVLRQIQERLEAAKEWLDKGATPRNVEYAAFHLRMVLELIVMGSLVTNRARAKAIAAALAKKDAGDARKVVKTANPNYWPRPARNTQGTLELTSVEGALTEPAWGREWGKLSKIVHARNPLAPPVDVETAHRDQCRLLVAVKKLLSAHAVTLVDRSHLLYAEVDETGSRVVKLTREWVPAVEPGSPMAAWLQGHPPGDRSRGAGAG